MYSTVTKNVFVLCLKGLKYHIWVGFFICFYIKEVEMVKISNISNKISDISPKNLSTPS